MNECAKISVLKGIGEKAEQTFAKVGVCTVGDLIRHYPRGYEIYEDSVLVSELEEGRVQTVTGMIYGRVQVSGNRNMQVTSIHVKDISGTITVIWFRMPFLRSTFSSGDLITLRGNIVRRKNNIVMEHPEIFYPSAKYEEKLHTLQPVYPLAAGLSNNAIVKAMRQALGELELDRDRLPECIRMTYGLAEYNYAIRGIHFPEDKEVYYHARERLVFEEFLEFMILLRRLKDTNERSENHFSIEHKNEVEHFMKELPYELTGAQQRVWAEIEHDICTHNSMSRLVQGDVGSGKTIVALLSLMTVGLNGYQAAMMAPTEVLAKQHYISITNLFEQYHIPLKTELLTGSMSAKDKRQAYARILVGESHIIVGTHALIQEKVTYKNLALVVTDEQHRFGVKQREYFAKKGEVPHVLVMSATPIPRTLAIILYGDLDISVIDELPANRLPIKNCVVDTDYRDTAYRFIKSQVAEGRQCYIICPMVEESEHLEVENVVDYASMLKETLGDAITVEYLHGRMKQSQKDEIMERFAANKIHVLVSTTVIEVGIDVPNATVMLVENAERFGLAQLHQLRGRVGRGKQQSYCIFMSSSKSKETKQRLNILSQSNDGFKIADEDLKLRGPGDLFGIRQSGLVGFRLGDVFQDAKLLKMASEAADRLLKENAEWVQALEERYNKQLVI